MDRSFAAPLRKFTGILTCKEDDKYKGPDKASFSIYNAWPDRSPVFYECRGDSLRRFVRKGTWEDLFSIRRFLERLALKRSIFRFKRMKV